MKRKLLIDCDPGHDDIMAIFLALAHVEAFEIVGLTTVGGNQTLDKVTNNLCQVLTYLGITLPIAKGYDAPLTRALEPQPLAHGESGLDGPILPKATVHPLSVHALDFLKERLEASDTPITIVALAPLTNIAMLLKTYPHLKQKIDCITLMGGGVQNGNILPKAEFNLYADPEAAKIVFQSDVPLIMSGVEVCADFSILHTEIDALQNVGYVSRLAHDILQFFSRYGRARGSDRSPLFDVAPILHLLDATCFTSEKYQVDIECNGEFCRGMSVVDTRSFRDKSKTNTEVLLHCDRDKAIVYMLDAIRYLDRRYMK